MADEGGHQKVLTCSQSMKKRQSVADEGGNQKVLTCSQSMKKRSCCVCTRSKSII